MMNFTIREMHSEEAATLRKLARPNFSVVEQCFMSKPKLGVIAVTEEGEIAGGAFLVIAEAGIHKTGCIDIMFVLPKFRGSGVAKMLYHGAVEAFYQQKCQVVFALVRGDNSQSLRRFQDEGLQPVTLRQLKQKIGLSGVAQLFVKTASLACATGCWILADFADERTGIGNSNQNIARVFYTNVFLLLLGTLFYSLLQSTLPSWWNIIAGAGILATLVIGETIGMKLAGEKWHFIMPEGGYVPSTVVVLLGGFFPMMGHWYLIDRNNTSVYRRRMATPAIIAWILLLIVTLINTLLYTIHPVCSGMAELGSMLVLFYALPFYPFDTIGGKRVRESSTLAYAALEILSILLLAFIWITF